MSEILKLKTKGSTIHKILKTIQNNLRHQTLCERIKNSELETIIGHSQGV